MKPISETEEFEITYHLDGAEYSLDVQAPSFAAAIEKAYEKFRETHIEDTADIMQVTRVALYLDPEIPAFF